MPSKFLDGGRVNGCATGDTVHVRCHVCRCVIKLLADVPVVEITNTVLCPCGGGLWPAGGLLLNDIEVADTRGEWVPVDLNPQTIGQPIAVPARAPVVLPANKRYGKTRSGTPSRILRHKASCKKLYRKPSKRRRKPIADKATKRAPAKKQVCRKERPAPASHDDQDASLTRPGTRLPIQPGGMTTKEWYHRVYLKSQLWTEIRKRILTRDNYRCRDCGLPTKIVHHLSYDEVVLDGRDDGQLISVCKGCHDRYHPEKCNGEVVH